MKFSDLCHTHTRLLATILISDSQLCGAMVLVKDTFCHFRWFCFSSGAWSRLFSRIVGQKLTGTQLQELSWGMLKMFHDFQSMTNTIQLSKCNYVLSPDSWKNWACWCKSHLPLLLLLKWVCSQNQNFFVLNLQLIKLLMFVLSFGAALTAHIFSRNPVFIPF